MYGVTVPFFGPKWHSLRSLLFQGPKSLDFQAPPPLQWPSKWICPHQNHYVPRHIKNRYIIVNIPCPPPPSPSFPPVLLAWSVLPFRMEQLQSYIWLMASSPHIWLNICVFPHVQYKEALPHIWLCNCSILNILTYEENFFIFYPCGVGSLSEFTPKHSINNIY